MGSFFEECEFSKECEHPESRWTKCPHEYRIRHRTAAGQRTEESGFATQEKARTRPAEVHHAREDSPQSQRHQGPTSLRNVESTPKNHPGSAIMPGRP